MQRSAIVPDGDGLKWISCKFFLLAERNWQEKHCWLLAPWKGYRSATIVGLTDKGYIVQVSSGAEIEVYPDEIEID